MYRQCFTSPIVGHLHRTITHRISNTYAKSIPLCQGTIESSRCWGQAEEYAWKLVYATVDPCMPFCPIKPERFRSGWTTQLDKLDKRISQLLKGKTMYRQGNKTNVQTEHHQSPTTNGGHSHQRGYITSTQNNQQSASLNHQNEADALY